MMSVEIIKMGTEQIHDINKPNQPFLVTGKIVPRFDGNEWSFDEVIYESPYYKEYPNDEIDYSDYIDNKDKVVFLSYMNGECVGQIRLRINWNEYCFVEDIAVSTSYRGRGIGTLLMQKAVEWAKSNRMHGLMLETQDNNLSACRFYRKCGFKIGGVDAMLYANFNNSSEKAMFWYMVFQVLT